MICSTPSRALIFCNKFVTDIKENTGDVSTAFAHNVQSAVKKRDSWHTTVATKGIYPLQGQTLSTW